MSSSPTHSLLASLTREFFQTETSAMKHCRREAERLGEAAPAQPLRAISAHAEGVLRELTALARAHGLPISGPGAFVGTMFSELRDKIADRLIRSERSYRGTMLGVRHGVDLVRLYAYTARAAGLIDLAAFCDRWLATRQPLVVQLEENLSWFAEHPEPAMRFAQA